MGHANEKERREQERALALAKTDEAGWKNAPAKPWYLQSDVVSSYEGWYSGKGERMDRLEKGLLSSLLGQFPNAETLLEVGAGTGHFTRWFEGLGLTTIGTDLSPLMLGEARARWDGSLVRSDAADLPFADDAYDLVAMITCFEYMPDPVRVLRETARVARKGLVIGLMNRWSWPTVRRRVQEAFGKTPFYTNAHFYSLPQIRRLLAEALEPGYRVQWRSTLFPPFIPIKDAGLPFGAFLGLAVHLNPKENRP